MTTRLTLLDACAVINFYATGIMEGVLASLPGPVAVADIVTREAQYVRRGGSGDDADEREQVDLAPYLAAGLVTVISTEDEDELLTFLDFSLVVDEGEAVTAALAVHRQATVVTDDRKAIRLLTTHGVQVRSTLAVLRTYCDETSASEDQVRLILSNLRRRARYEPRRDHPYRPWWDTVLGG